MVSGWVKCLTAQATDAVLIGRLSLVVPAHEQEEALRVAGEVAQKACAGVAKGNVPSFVGAALADMLPAVFGIVVLIIFGRKVELWREVRVRLFGGGGSEGEVVIAMEEPRNDVERSSRGLESEEGQRSMYSHRPQYQEQEQRALESKSDVQLRRGRSQGTGGFYSGDLGMEADELNSRDLILEHSETPRYEGKQSRSRSRSRSKSCLSHSGSSMLWL